MPWRCCMCNIGEHDSCMGSVKICLCETCWTDEDDDEDG